MSDVAKDNILESIVPSTAEQPLTIRPSTKPRFEISKSSYVVPSSSRTAAEMPAHEIRREAIARDHISSGSITALSSSVVFLSVFTRSSSVALNERHFSVPNVPHHLSLLASGVTPAREAEAGGMTEVPKA